MEGENKSAAIAGVFVGTSFTTLLILAFFLLAPVAHYLGEWSDYWNTPEQTLSTVSTAYQKAMFNAEADCEQRAEKKFNLPGDVMLVRATNITVEYASSTSADYRTYDCYAVPLEKLPAK